MSNEAAVMAISIVALVVSVAVAICAALALSVDWRERRRLASVNLFELHDSAREDRGAIRRAVLPLKRDDPDKVDWEKVDADTLASFDNVARFFAFTGALDRLGMLRRDFIDAFYTISFYELWVRYHLGEYIQWQRNVRGSYHFWEAVELHKRTQFVWANHPEVTGRKNWPRNPRRRPNKIDELRDPF